MSRRRNLGHMRHRLTIMQTVRVDDGGGGTERQDTVAATVWARIKIASAREKMAYGQLQERVTHTVMIRTRNDVDNGSTVVWLPQGTLIDAEPDDGATEQPAGTELYVLTCVDADPDGRPGEFLQLACEERTTI